MSETRPTRVGTWWEYHFLLGEFALCILFFGVTVAWATAFGGLSTLEDQLGSDRATFYATLASLFGALFGFGITAASIIAALVDRPRFDSLRRNANYPTLWETLIQTVIILAIASAVSVVGLVFDHGMSPGFIVLLVLLFSVYLSVARLARTIWFLGLILDATKANSPPEIPAQCVADNRYDELHVDIGSDPPDDG